MSSTTRDSELDLLRGIAIAAVVGIHTTWFHLGPASLAEPAGRIVALIHLLTGFGVPLFFAMSAIGLASRYDGPMTRSEYLDFLKRRALRLLPAYVIWSIVSIATLKPHLFQSPGELSWILVNGGADVQFYFIPLIFTLYLAWPVIRPLTVWSRTSGAAVIVVLAAGTALNVWWWKLGATGALPPIAAANLPAWGIYLAMGVVGAPLIPDLRLVAMQPAVRLVAAGVTAFTAWNMFRNFLALVTPHYRPDAIWFASTIMQVPSALYIVSTILLLFCIVAGSSSRWWTTMFQSLSERSYGIYLVHLLVLRHVVHPLLPPAWVHHASISATLGIIALSWGLCLAGSYLLVRILSVSRMTLPLVSNRW